LNMQISRRTVLRGIAAALMAPTIQLRASVPDERLLLPFCNADITRWNLDAPFGLGSLTYATDTRAMIRAEIANRQEVGERKLPPKIDEIWANWFRPAQQWRRLTSEDIQPTVEDCGPCFVCGDRRVSAGEFQPEWDYYGVLTDKTMRSLDYDCDDHTIRDASCGHCKGQSNGHNNIAVIFGQEHKAYDLKRILALPNAMVCESEWHPDKHAPGLLFRADGFEGIALGLVPKSERWK